jgi:UDP-GlcNAc:undecaprenyl-phosphate GlcNAc-1-phosphate transferase
MISLAVVACIALLVSMLAVPPIVRMARSHNLLDRPDCSRRVHTQPVPRIGGIAVWLGAVAGFGSWLILNRGTGAIASLPSWSLGALAGLVVMAVTGLVDDVRGVRPRTKIIAQVIAALLVVGAGFRIDAVTLGGDATVSLGWFGAPLALLWIVGVTNAVNLIDGLDGLAGGITLVTVTALGASAVLGGTPAILPVMAALAGGMLGFLRFNRSPARIFLGDVGSLSIGFALALLSIEGARQQGGPIAIVVAGFVLAFPVLDTAIAMLRRWLRVVPLSGADDRHVHHQLVGLGLTHHRASALICLFASGVALLGLSITYAPPVLTAAISLIGLAAWVLMVVHGTRWLQYHEFQEAQASFTSGFLRARHVIRDRILARDLEHRLRSAESIEDISRLLDEHRSSLGFDILALCDATDLRLRTATALAVMDQRPQLTFPVTGKGWSGGEGLLILAAWRRETRQPPLYSERVIRIIVPAVEEVLARIVAPAPVAATGMGIPALRGSDGYAEKPPAIPVIVRRKADVVAHGVS